MPGVQVGRHARIRNAIIDRDVLVPRGAVIGYDEAADRARHAVTERGIVVVTVDDEPRVEPIAPEALARESRADTP
jgi:glucose-1-phosphate adenylyltransferase